MPFSQEGAGLLLGDIFNREVTEHAKASQSSSGTTLLIATDIGGSHAGQPFETYSFLVMELEANARWLAEQRVFRQRVLRSNRRMAFKSLNDKLRRAALPSFLEMGTAIHGSLITFAISRNRASIFEAKSDEDEEKLLACWPKKAVRERLMRLPGRADS